MAQFQVRYADHGRHHVHRRHPPLHGRLRLEEHGGKCRLHAPVRPGPCPVLWSGRLRRRLRQGQAQAQSRPHRQPEVPAAARCGRHFPVRAQKERRPQLRPLYPVLEPRSRDPDGGLYDLCCLRHRRLRQRREPHRRRRRPFEQRDHPGHGLLRRDGLYLRPHDAGPAPRDGRGRPRSLPLLQLPPGQGLHG